LFQWSGPPSPPNRAPVRGVDQLVMTRAEDLDGALCPAPDLSRLGGAGRLHDESGSKRRPRPPLVAGIPASHAAYSGRATAGQRIDWRFLDAARHRASTKTPKFTLKHRALPDARLLVSLKFSAVVEWTDLRHNRRARESLPDGQRACLGLCHWLHAGGHLSVGGQGGGFWRGALGVGGTGLARPRVEHGTRCHSLAGLVDSRTRTYSCPVAHVVRSAPPT